MQSACEVSGAAHVPGEADLSAARRHRALGRLPARHSWPSCWNVPVEMLAAKSSAAQVAAPFAMCALFADRPDASALAPVGDAVGGARASSRTLRGQLDIRYLFDWAGGLVWLEVPPAQDAGGSRSCAARCASGPCHADPRARSACARAVDVFQPQAPALAALSARVKDSFDPRHIFNPGRMYRGHLMQTNFTAEQLATPAHRGGQHASCANACIAASAPPPAPPMCCSATSSTARAAAST